MLQRKESELKDLDRKSRKTMGIHTALQTKSNVDRLYIKRNKAGKNLIHVESCIRKDENSLGFFMLRILKKTSSGELLQLRQSILKTL